MVKEMAREGKAIKDSLRWRSDLKEKKQSMETGHCIPPCLRESELQNS